MADTKETKAEINPTSGGDVPTLPGQTELVAGSVEHQQELNKFANATSYAPDVNVVQPPAETPPPPPDTVGGAMSGGNVMSGGTYQSDTKHDTKHDTKSGRDKS